MNFCGCIEAPDRARMPGGKGFLTLSVRIRVSPELGKRMLIPK